MCCNQIIFGYQTHIAMSISNKIIILHFLPSMVFGTIDMKIKTLFPSISNDDACSYVINEYPCFMNILNVLAKYSNNNKQEIESLKLKIFELENIIDEKISRYEEKIEKILSKKLSDNVENYEIDKKKLELKDISSYRQSEIDFGPNDYQMDQLNVISHNIRKVRKN